MRAALRDARVDAAVKRAQKKPSKKPVEPTRYHTATSDTEAAALRAKAKPGDRILHDYDLLPGEVNVEVVRAAPKESTRQFQLAERFRRHEMHLKRRATARKKRMPAVFGVASVDARGPRVPRIKGHGQHRRRLRKWYRENVVGKLTVISRARAQNKGTRTPERRKAKNG